MHLGISALIAGAGVGLVVGITGSGGGALLTPILILLLGVNAKTAVASDLVATLFMRPVAAAVHLRRKTIHWSIVAWLVVGSVPSAFLAGFASHRLISSTQSSSVLSPVIGATLIVTGSVAILRRALQSRRTAQGRAEHCAVPFVIRPSFTVIIGAVGGLAVGVTSVGAGTLMLVGLGVLYPMLGVGELVGTDLVQAIPLVGAAALGHLASGNLHLALTASVIVGGVPAAFSGALLARYVPERPLGAIVALVIFGSGCALIGWRAGSIVGAIAVMALAALWWRLRSYRRARAVRGLAP